MFESGIIKENTTIKLVLEKLSGTKFGMYMVIGGVASAIDIGLFLLLHLLVGLPAIASHSVSIPISAVFSFSCNAYYNFKKTDKILLRLLSFSIVVFIGYLLGVALIWVVDDVFDFGGTIGKFVSLPFVVLLQFFLNTKMSFRG